MRASWWLLGLLALAGLGAWWSAPPPPDPEAPGPALPVARTRAFLRFDAEGRRIAVADGTLQVWEIAGRKRLLHAECPTDVPVAFSPALDRLALGREGKVEIQRLPDLRPVGSLEIPGGVQSVAWSPRPGHLACSGGRDTLLWDLDESRLVARLEGGAPAFSPDGRTLATATPDRILRIWEVPSGRLLRSFGPSGKAWDESLPELAFLDPRTLAEDSQVLWDTLTGTVRHRFQSEYHRGGEVLAGGPGGLQARRHGTGVAVTREDSAVCVVGGLSPGREEVAAFTPDGSLLATADDEGVRLWDLPQGRLAALLPRDGRSAAQALAEALREHPDDGAPLEARLGPIVMASTTLAGLEARLGPGGQAWGSQWQDPSADAVLSVHAWSRKGDGPDTIYATSLCRSEWLSQFDRALPPATARESLLHFKGPRGVRLGDPLDLVLARLGGHRQVPADRREKFTLRYPAGVDGHEFQVSIREGRVFALGFANLS